MLSISGAIFYILTFLAVYVQVFFLVTFFENKKRIITRDGKIKLLKYPAVTVLVPCWNEEKTIDATVHSILGLNYPKDKVKIFLIDDGSTDNTLPALQKFAKYSNVKIFHQENGGKHTALNLGLEQVETEFVGCLDADSSADPEALVRIMSYFEKDPSAMAVSPSIIANSQANIIHNAQKAEYDMSVYIKKMLGFLGAIHVAPGPLTIFRKKVFDDLGPYRHAHNTEDMEIAYRMQAHHYKIEQCNDAYVCTNTPPSVRKLYRQRLRWIYGFINNSIDYRGFLFKKKYGNFSLFTVPAGIIAILAAVYLFGRAIYNLGDFVIHKIFQIKTAGFYFASQSGLDPFFINTRSFLFITIFLYFSVILSMVIGRKMVEGKWGVSVNMFYFFFIYSVIAPFWLFKAVYNTILSRKPAWR